MTAQSLYLRIIAFLIPVLQLVLTGCEEKEVKPSFPVLTMEKSMVDVPNAGGQFSISYDLINPSEDGQLNVVPAEDWVDGFDYSVPGTISFNVLPNEVPEERRNKVTVMYSTLGYEVKEHFIIVQGAGKRPDFTIKIDKVTAQSVKATVTPNDSEIPYTFMNVSKNYYEGLGGNDEALFADILNTFKSYAEAYGVSLGDFLERNVYLRGEKTGEFDRLYSENQYYVLAVGISTDGEQTTDLIKEEYSTEAVQKTNLSFDVTYDISGSSAVMKVKPSDASAMYYCTAVEKSKLSDFILNEYLQDLVWRMVDSQVSLGLSEEEAVKAVCKTGDNDFSFNLMAETEYAGLSVGVDQSGLLCSEISQNDFTTEEVKMSDNIIEVELVEVNTDRFSYSITTTNSDTYVFMMGESELYEDMSDEEILDFIRENYSFKNNQLVSGNIEGNKGGLSPLTEYTLLLFGYNGGVITTDLTKCEFTTLDICRNPETATFEFKRRLAEEGTYYWVDLIPDPINVRYVWNRAKSDQTAEDVLNDWEWTISMYGGDVQEAMFWSSSRGRLDISMQPNTKLYAFGLNEETGEVVTDVFFSEVMPPLESSEAMELPSEQDNESKVIFMDKPLTKSINRATSDIDDIQVKKYAFYTE